jgi:thiol-disulfide isomerase/thioredoxin
MVREITEWQFDRPTVVKIWSPTCAPCKMFAPRFERIADEHPEYDFAAAQLENNVEEVVGLGIRSIPTVVVFDGGETKILSAQEFEKAL